MRAEDIEAYRVQIEQDLEWRLAEVALFTNTLNSFRSLDSTEAGRDKETVQKNIYRKALVTMLYAHFEGFFRKAFEVYASAINEEQIEITRALQVLSISSLQHVFENYDDINKWTIQSETDIFNKSTKRIANRTFLMEEILKYRNTGVIKLYFSADHRDKKSILNTESNLTPDIIAKILYRLGISPTDLELDDENFKTSINEFLGRRNQIAHGDGQVRDGVDERSYNKYKSSFDRITSLIPIIISRALEGKYYLLPENR